MIREGGIRWFWKDGEWCDRGKQGVRNRVQGRLYFGSVVFQGARSVALPMPHLDPGRISDLCTSDPLRDPRHGKEAGGSSDPLFGTLVSPVR